jgi:hypothetical protein
VFHVMAEGCRLWTPCVKLKTSEHARGMTHQCFNQASKEGANSNSKYPYLHLYSSQPFTYMSSG